MHGVERGAWECWCAGREKRKNLRVRQPEKYKWKPQELLAQLAHIYLHLARADSAGLFVGAIAADERSYHEGLFSDAADVSTAHLRPPLFDSLSRSHSVATCMEDLVYGQVSVRTTSQVLRWLGVTPDLPRTTNFGCETTRSELALKLFAEEPDSLAQYCSTTRRVGLHSVDPADA